MRTPKQFDAHARSMYQPALLTCPHGGDRLVMGNYLAWKKTVPLRLAGRETYERLQHVARGSLDLLAQRSEPRLAQVAQGLQTAWSPFAATSQA